MEQLNVPGSIASNGWAVCKGDKTGARVAPIARHVYGSKRAAERALEILRSKKPQFTFSVNEVTICVSPQQR
ncbi:MAG: hypothetical protein AB9873_05340 [Syntrophobacteraceae bacterium]